MQYSLYRIIVGGTKSARDRHRKEFDCLSDAEKHLGKLKVARDPEVHTLYLLGVESGNVQRLLKSIKLREPPK
jgi:hypothetical protein